ncbi:MAG: hypothetical protein U5N85_02620 [Arcicella sp.]|nr:hypothetical protein [Arcicella sp.]
MKKIIILLLIVGGIIACKKDSIEPSADNCQRVANEYTTAINAWATDPNSKSKCEAVKKSLTNILSACSAYTAIQKKEYEDELKQFDCN